MRIVKRGKHYRTWFYGVVIPFFLSSCTYTYYTAQAPYPQIRTLQKVAVLSDTINETSALAVDGDDFLTLNDSGGEAALYTYDKDAKLRHKTTVAQTLNVDWEAIADDDRFLYVADVGNNFGRRDTLLIYKVLKQSIGSDTVSCAGVISFSYDEEVTKNEDGWYSHDCESIFAFGDSLYMHAKDWVKKETRVYVIPKEPGHYSIRSRRSYQVNALVTGSDIFPERNEVVLVGYRNYMPIIIKYSYNSDPASIDRGGKARIFPLKVGTQSEAIVYDAEGRIYVTAEKSIHNQAMYRAY